MEVMDVKEYSLREKKHAKTKIAIMSAFMKRLKHSRFEDICIRSVCEDAEVAASTFFNYFPAKIDVIGYYLFLTSAAIIWKSKKKVPAGKYLLLIDSVFSRMSEEMHNSNLVYQILSVLISQSAMPKNVSFSALEIKLAFPDSPGIEEMPSMAIGEWFKEFVGLARENGELPSNINVDDVVVSLMTILSGTLLAIRFSDSNSRGYHYMRQLQALWQGFGRSI